MKMKRTLALTATAVVMLFGPILRVAAVAAAPQAASQATLQGDLLKEWQGQKDMLMKIADAMPEDKFIYKPTPAQRDYGAQVMHVAQINVMLLKTLGGKAAAPTFTPQSAKTKAEILKALADSFDFGTAVIKEQTDATLIQTVPGPPWMGPSTRVRMLSFLMGHTMDIYGQMAVYLRLNGVVPPASRGV